MTCAIPSGKAGAGLSPAAKDARGPGADNAVVAHGGPSSTTTPISESAPVKLKAKGMLAGKRLVASRGEERASYAESLEEKYANPT